ncbi:MAG: hypothetical protein AAFX78_04910 [Cyanobacteria bacterium J06638_20]
MENLEDLIREIEDNDPHYAELANSPVIQFGTEREPFRFAQLLPERLVNENAYREKFIRMIEAPPALDGTRYGPTQMQKGGIQYADFLVELGYTDTGDYLVGRELDALYKLLETSNGTPEAIASVTRWIDLNLVRPHLRKNEIQRRDAMLLGTVTRKISDEHSETITYYTPSGFRPEVAGGTVASPAGLFATSTATDPWDNILAARDLLGAKGKRVVGMWCTSAFLTDLGKNPSMKLRANHVTVNASGQIQGYSRRVKYAELSELAQEDGLPPFTVVDEGYPLRTNNMFQRYMEPTTDRHYLLMVGSTDNAITIDGLVQDNDSSDLIELEVMGYYGIGTNAAQSAPGRTLHTWVEEKKPRGLGGESYQAGLPVIQEPESFVVIEWLKPTES